MLYEEVTRFISELLLNGQSGGSDQMQAFHNTIDQEMDEDSVYTAVTSSKFRKTAIDNETERDIRSKIRCAYKRKDPLHFSIPFGAYKSWRLNLGIAPDWAEVFHMSFLYKYGKQISTCYPYGVRFHYSFQGGLMYFISNVPKESLENYRRIFCALLDYFNTYDPTIQFDLVDIRTLYNSDEDYYIDFLENLLDNLVYWDSKYDDSVKSRHFQSAEHNVFLNGKLNLENKSDYIKGKYYYYSALMTDAVDNLSKRRPFNKGSKNIQLVCVKGPSKCINIGACETSTVHFWVGQGFAKRNKGTIKPYVFSVSNSKKLLPTAQLVCVDSPFFNIHQNFKSIPFLD